MAKTKATARDCIAAIKATAAKGEISDAKAKEIMDDIETRTRHRAAAKQMKLEDALTEITGEWVVYQKTSKELQKRNHLLGIKRLREIMDFTHEHKNMGRGLERFLQNAWGSWRSLEMKYMDRLYSQLRSQGVWQDFSRGLLGREIFNEVWELSRGAAGTPGVSKSASAQKIARVVFDIKRELNALENRHGAYILDAIGHVIIQGHDPHRLRNLGSSGWGKEDMHVAREKWKTIMGSLNVDWERTLDGRNDKNAFMDSFFENIYSRVFGDAREIDIDQFKPQGSLASRISSGRVLWFKDADSAWKYNEMFGIKEVNEAIFSQIRQATRNAALLMHFGPNPKGTWDTARTMLAEEASHLPDAQKQVHGIKVGPTKLVPLQSQFDKLTGLADMVERPTVSRIVDNIRSTILLAKGGKIILSAFTDKAFMQNTMVYHGVRAADRFAAQIGALFGKQGDPRLKTLSFYLQSEIGEIARQWTDDVRPSRGLQRGLHWMFKATGLNSWTTRHRYAMAQVLGKTVGDQADTAFSKLPPEFATYFREHGITTAEWNAWRSKAELVDDMDGGGNKMLLPDQVEKFSDADWNAIAREQGLKETSANRARLKDELESKLRSYWHEAVMEAIPEPGLRETALRSAAGARGSLWRSIADLAMIFKGFPITVGMQLAGRERLRMGGEGTMKQWLALGDKGKYRVGMLIVEAGILGYLSMTVRDMLEGKTPKQLADEDGNVNWQVLFAALQRGGGLGIYGDFLFSEYDMRMRDFTSALVGPAFSQLNPLFDILTSARKSALEEDGPEAEAVLYKLERFAEDNTPFVNMWMIKPVLDWFIFYSMREALSPGVLNRMERSLESRGVQEYYISPAEIESLGPEERLPYAVKQITE